MYLIFCIQITKLFIAQEEGDFDDDAEDSATTTGDIVPDYAEFEAAPDVEIDINNPEIASQQISEIDGQMHDEELNIIEEEAAFPDIDTVEGEVDAMITELEL